MKSKLIGHVPSPEVLKGGLLASLFGSLPTIGTGAEYLVINLIHGVDFATGGHMGENRKHQPRVVHRCISRIGNRNDCASEQLESKHSL